MKNRSRFSIENGSTSQIAVYVEPEGVEVLLEMGQELSVVDSYDEVPVDVKVSNDDKFGVAISIWPGDGEIKVTKDGVDVLELP